MGPVPSIIQRTIVVVAVPTVAILMGLPLGSVQTQVTLSIPSPDVSFQITVGPPPIPVYEQPAPPDEGYLWSPGYWAWGGEGYFWVPGTWVMAPEIGLLWTPGYWGWGGQAFVFHEGYWGSHVGFYGGINYGYGYGGSGFDGGHWQGRNYSYNRAVTNVNNTRITNVYNNTVIVNNDTRVAYYGGEGGLRAAPTPQDQTAERERHMPLTTEQTQHHQSASQNKELLASANRGKPPVAATLKPADFSPKNVVPAKATGGPVEEAALKATPKTLAPPSKNPLAETKPTSPAAPPEPQAIAPLPATESHPVGPVVRETVAPAPQPKIDTSPGPAVRELLKPAHTAELPRPSAQTSGGAHPSARVLSPKTQSAAPTEVKPAAHLTKAPVPAQKKKILLPKEQTKE